MLKRRVMLVVFLCFAISLALSVSSEVKAEKITFLTHPTLYKVMGGEEKMKEFTTLTDIEVEVVTMPIQQIREKIMIEFLSNSGRFDVINGNDSIFNTDVAKHLEPLNDFIKNDPPEDADDIIPSLIDIFSYPKGQVYGIPCRVGTAVIYYRKDLFEKYGIAVPKTWEELKEAAHKLTLDLDGDGKIDIYGYGIKAGDSQTIGSDFLRYFFSFGGEILSDDLQSVRFNEPPGVQTLELLRYFAKEKLVDPDFTTWLRDDLIIGQQQGRIAMTLQFSPYYGRLVDPEVSKVAGKISGFPLPTISGVKPGRTWNSAWGLFINKHGEKKKAAWELIKFLTNSNNQLEFALKYSNGPVRSSVYASQEYRDFLGPELVDCWKTGLEAGVGIPPHPEFSQMEDAISEAVLAVVLGNKEPKEALDEATSRVTQILQRKR